MSPLESERLVRVSLARLAEPGSVLLLSMVSDLGATAVRESLLRQGDDLGGASADLAARLDGHDPARTLEQGSRLGLRFVIPGDDEWPLQLDDLAEIEPLHERGGSPLGLWVKGPLRLDSLTQSVAVVGARSASTYGADVAGEIGCSAGMAGWAVVSGAAYGIDQAAHRGALAGEGPTVAVLACGADRIYPRAHADLLEHVARDGAVVSEALPGWAPTRIRFLARNRLIAGLTRGTVIVEAALRSGALNTANWADRLSRTLMGVPGPVTSALSEGVHQFLRRSGAAVVTSGADVLELLGASGAHLQDEERGPTRARDRLSRRQQQVLDAVPVAAPARVDSIARTAGIPMQEVQSALRRLLERDLVERTSAGWRLSQAAR